MHVIAAALVALVSTVYPAAAQTIVYTTRTHLNCPVLITSSAESKTFGFSSVVLSNDSPHNIAAITFRLALRRGLQEETLESQRLLVSLDRREKKRVEIHIGNIEALRQKARAWKQETAMAVLSIDAVEFSDGEKWTGDEPVQGVPLQPFRRR